MIRAIPYVNYLLYSVLVFSKINAKVSAISSMRLEVIEYLATALVK